MNEWYRMSVYMHLKHTDRERATSQCMIKEESIHVYFMAINISNMCACVYTILFQCQCCCKILLFVQVFDMKRMFELIEQAESQRTAGKKRVREIVRDGILNHLPFAIFNIILCFSLAIHSNLCRHIYIVYVCESVSVIKYVHLHTTREREREKTKKLMEKMVLIRIVRLHAINQGKKGKFNTHHTSIHKINVQTHTEAEKKNETMLASFNQKHAVDAFLSTKPTDSHLTPFVASSLSLLLVRSICIIFIFLLPTTL